MLSRNLEQENSSSNRNAYKVRAFARAIEVIGVLDKPVRNVDEVKKLKGVGVGISNRIGAFLSGQDYSPEAAASSSKARKISDTEKKREKMIIRSLTSVSGIGTMTAKSLVEAGCTSIADLKQPKYSGMLSSPQLIGLRYHEDLGRPVERNHAEQLLTFISENISCKFDLELVDSYRRGAPSFSGVDILLTHPSHVHVPTPPPPSSLVTQIGRTPFRVSYTKLREAQDSLLLRDVVVPLESRGLIVETLSTGSRKWQGVIRLPERTADGAWEERSHRIERIRDQQGLYIRLDLNLAPMKSKGAALLALTGDKEFNIDIRNKAARLGLFLNEFGLWRWTSDTLLRGDADEASNSKGYWSFIEGESEAAVLRELGMSYVEPIKRNFAYLADSNPEVSIAKKRGRPRKNVA
ncbi:Nucleotidyltransferase [Rhizopogon vinicolor AM-OR11-026]|uniref:DNA polymerase n=1 Tax=Rhizopogon vinicolor AM-OR11-026 TaxID=1314800 RepID=A0A1B7N6E7_9AGAM|nr:Nucleotidyltransferase [Rhizopogon vinicolor AM-OR11-026]